MTTTNKKQQNNFTGLVEVFEKVILNTVVREYREWHLKVGGNIVWL